MKFSCLLIGAGHLLTQCATLLLEHCHDITCVISSSQPTQLWCQENSIPCVGSLNDLLVNEKYIADYLFSIVNKHILTSKELALARLGAINYHDSLLPKYAGVHATTWAILAKEQSHGVTWHRMEEGIDDGDIIYQSAFVVSGHDTAFTLNLRCFEEALKGFDQVMCMLETRSLKRRAQAKQGRSYYGFTHLLPHLGFINWRSDSAEDIHDLARALNFGDYPNRVGSLKLYVPSSFVVVSEIKRCNASLPHKIDEGGVILAIEDKGLLVSTITDPVFIKEFRTSGGEILSAKALCKHYKLCARDRFPIIDHQVWQSQIPSYKAALKDESYWLDKLHNAYDEPVTFPTRFFKNTTEYQELSPLILSDVVPQKWIGRVDAYLFTSVLLYLYRLNDYKKFAVFLYAKHPTNKGSQTCGLFADFLPIALDFASDLTGVQLLSHLTDELDAVRHHCTYLNDVFVRHPPLHPFKAEGILTISVSEGGINVPQQSLIHFHIDQQSHRLHIYHRLDLQHQARILKSVIASMHIHLTHILCYLIDQPTTLIHQFSFLTEKEQKKLLSLGVGPFIPLPRNTIVDLFEQQVRRMPTKPAIYTAEDTVTYTQLWETYKQLSASFQKIKPSSASYFALYIPEKTILLALGLAILNGGCCYEVLDTSISIRAAISSDYSPACRYLVTTVAFFHPSFQRVCHYSRLYLYAMQNSSANLVLSGTHSTSDYDTFMPITIGQENCLHYSCWFAHTTNLTQRSVLDVSPTLPSGAWLSCVLASLVVGSTFVLHDSAQILNPETYVEQLQQHQVTHVRLSREDWESLCHYTDKIRPLKSLCYCLVTSRLKNARAIAGWLLACPGSRFIVIPNFHASRRVNATKDCKSFSCAPIETKQYSTS